MYDTLYSQISALGIAIDTVQIQLLDAYTELLLKWNKVYNLTAITKLADVITYHILDGLSVVPHVAKEAKHIIDVGSGMGVPGIILAICHADKRFTLIDSNHKKAAFLQQVVIELKLTNVQVVCARVEDYQAQIKYDVITARAFGNAVTLIEQTRHLANEHASWMLMKSQQVFNEIKQLEATYHRFKHNLISIKLPQVNDERYLLVIDKISQAGMTSTP